jgi:hypothetical protein
MCAGDVCVVLPLFIKLDACSEFCFPSNSKNAAFRDARKLVLGGVGDNCRPGRGAAQLIQTVFIVPNATRIFLVAFLWQQTHFVASDSSSESLSQSVRVRLPGVLRFGRGGGMC